jgi:hypothetical protein
VIIPGDIGVQTTIYMSVCVNDTMVSVCMSRCVCVCVCVIPLALFQVEFRVLV